MGVSNNIRKHYPDTIVEESLKIYAGDQVIIIREGPDTKITDFWALLCEREKMLNRGKKS